MAAIRPSTRHQSQLLDGAIVIGQAVEADVAQRLAVPTGRATETDLAQPVVRFSLAAWTWSRSIRISSLNYNTLTRQVAIDLSTIPTIFASAKADGSDIRVTDSSRATPLPFYLTNYNAGTHTGTLWVKLTGLTTAGTTIYLFAGNPAATSVASFDSTFQKLTPDSKTKLLWHMDEGSGTTVSDASANTLNGTVTGATWVGADGGGWNGTATSFTSGDCLSFAAGNKVANTSYVCPARGEFSLWLRPDFASTVGAHKQIAFFGTSGNYRYVYFNYTDQSFRVDTSTGTILASTSQTFAANTWLHLAVVWYDNPNNTRKVYVNGVDVTATNDTTKTFAADNGFSFGFNAVRGEAGFSGRADELRLSNYPRMPEEVQASYQRRAPLPANPVITKNAGNPTMPPTAVWEGSNTDEPTVLLESGTWKMWYRGGNPFSSPFSGIGYATSSDGVTWTKYVSNPIIAGTSGNAFWTPFVFKSGLTYYLFSTNQLSPSSSTIVRFESTDGITWTNQITALTLSGLQTNFGNKYVWIEGSTWYMIYEWQHVSGDWSLSLATSPDGVTWTKQGVDTSPILSIGGGPELHKIGSYYYLLVQVAPTPGAPSDVYLYRSADLLSWAELGTNPVLWRTATYETDQVADASLVENAGTTSIFFEGVHGLSEQVGSATAPYTINQFLTAAEAPTYSSSGVTVTIGQATETDTSLALLRHHTIVLGQATETDNALGTTPITNPIVTTRGQVSVSDASTYTVTLSDAGTYMLTIADTAV